MKLKDQFQIGNQVIYKPESVITTVSGYVWSTSINDKPAIIAYELSCGISAQYDDIEKHHVYKRF